MSKISQLSPEELLATINKNRANKGLAPLESKPSINLVVEPSKSEASSLPSDGAKLSDVSSEVSKTTPTLGMANTAKDKEGSTTVSNISESDPEAIFKEYLDPKAEYHPLAVEDPIEFLYLYDENIANGDIKLHKWQIESLMLACQKGVYTKEYPLRLHLCACNSSGKDAYFNAVVAIYLSVTLIRHRCIITSASYTQLNTQTESYIRTLCHKVNRKMEEELGIPRYLIYKRGRVACSATGSEIKLFVTDEAGKAEGDHPFPDHPNAEMTILVNEAKSVGPDIYVALRRCLGYNRWILISSPGKPSGDFFAGFSAAVQYPAKFDRTKAYARRITAYDCPHISGPEIERARLELRDAIFRNIFLAEFVSLDEETVVTLEAINECLKNPPAPVNGELAGGLDLSLGGDETVFIPRQGNRMLGLKYIRVPDTQVMATIAEKWFQDYGFIKHKTPIYTDVTGPGKPIFDTLCARGWNCVAVVNAARARNSLLYSNLVAEQWFHTGDLISKKQVILLDDEKLKDQLSSRHYDTVGNGRIKLESKEDMRAAGRSSPDRADALVMAFCDYVGGRVVSKEDSKNLSRISQSQLVAEMEKQRFASFGHAGKRLAGMYGNERPFNIGTHASQQRLLQYALEGVNKSKNK